MKNTINNITLAILLFFGAVQVSYAVEQTKIDKNDNIIRAVNECSYPNICYSNGEKLNETAKVIESMNAISELSDDPTSLEMTKNKINEINANYSEDFDKLENSVYEMQTVELEQYVNLLNTIRTSNDSLKEKNIKYKAVSDQLTSAMNLIKDSFKPSFDKILKIKEQKTHEVYAEHMNKEAVTKKQ